MSPVRLFTPEGLHANPAFSHVAVVEGPCRQVWIGGQNAVDAAGAIVGRGDVRRQAEQVLANLELVLAAAGARIEHIVKWSIYLREGADARAAHGVFQAAWGQLASPPILTVLQVAGLAHPDFLLEVEGLALVPAAADAELA